MAPNRFARYRPRGRLAAVAGVLAVGVLAFALWAALFELRARRTGDGFDITRWELSTAANKWLFAIGAPLRDDPPSDAALASYFALADRGGEGAARLENVVEAAIEGRIDALLRDLDVHGLISLPGPLDVWPPVDVELARSPRVLVTSPRDRILRLGIERLRVDLTVDEAVAVEREVESDDQALSARVVSTGGLALYPAVVSIGGSYARTLDTAAHEWTHHYLAFYPLGFGIPAGDRQIINETVADIAGEEIATLVLERFGDPTASVAPTPAQPSPVDRDRVLRELRLEVEALLADGRVDEAERRMEEVRLELEAAGVHIRRINQAYFAWIGTYAAREDAVDSLGPQLWELRERSGSLARFLEVVRDARSRSDVARLLEAASGN